MFTSSKIRLNNNVNKNVFQLLPWPYDGVILNLSNTAKSRH